MLERAEQEIQMPHDYSRPLDVNRWSDYPELRNCITDLIAEIEQQEQRARIRDAGDRKRLREAVRTLVLDLYVAWRTDPELCVSIALSANHYNKTSRYRAIFLSHKAITSALHGLVNLGYVEIVRKGFHDPRTNIGRVTRIRATDKLLSVLVDRAELKIADVRERTISEDGPETIILRGVKPRRAKRGPEVDYEETPTTERMRAELQEINTVLSRHWIDIYITDQEMLELRKRMWEDYVADTRERGIVDFTRRSLVRIFNNGSFEQGGRLYGGWWQSIPKEYRRYITIDGKPTVERDYSETHAALLYAKTGKALVGGAYDPGKLEVPRDVIKIAFNILLNAKGVPNRPADFDEAQYGISWRDLLDHIRERHKPIEQFLGTGAGVFLQGEDAHIAHNIVLHFARRGYPCLPVHDSFIIHYGLQDELNSMMQHETEQHTGMKLPSKKKSDYQSKLKPELTTFEDTETTHVSALEEARGLLGDYTEYLKRNNDWYSSKGVGRGP